MKDLPAMSKSDPYSITIIIIISIREDRLRKKLGAGSDAGRSKTSVRGSFNPGYMNTVSPLYPVLYATRRPHEKLHR